MAVALGCDVCPIKPVPGYGPDKFWKLVQNMPSDMNNDNKYKYLFDQICEMSKTFTPNDIRTLCVAFISEPVALTGDSNFRYLFGKPHCLPKYLECYKHQDDETINIFDGPNTLQCCGLGINNGTSHMFLECEGAHICEICSTTFCTTCGYVPSTNKKVADKVYYTDRRFSLCLPCYCKNTFPNDDVDNNDLSVNEMIKV